VSSSSRMATVQFTSASPYQGIATRTHHASDYKYEAYNRAVAVAGGPAAPPVRLAVFGLGRAGSIHLANILANPRVVLAYVVESDTARWEAVRARWNLTDTQFVHPDQADVVYADPSLAACLVCTPTFTHEKFIVDSLQAGKAVFSEKPISEEAAGTARCYSQAAAAGKPLFCAFNRRFDPSFSAVRDRVRAGELGRVQMIKTTSRDSPLPGIEYLKISGGIFHDCAVHDIDLVTWILGEYPCQVFAAANSHIPEIGAIQDWDNVAITFTFTSGSLATVDLARFACYGYDQRLEVFGPGGMLEVKNEPANNTVYSGSEGSSRVPIFYSFPSRHADGYSRELNHFLDVVQMGVEPSVTGLMTSAVSRIATACEESARSGLPVKLEWTPEQLPDGYTA